MMAPKAAPALRWIAGIALALGAAVPLRPTELPPGCTVTALNRWIQIGESGRWVLNNVPAGLPVRARVVCQEDGQVRMGQSDLFTVPNGGQVQIPPITFAAVTPIPRFLTVASPEPVLRTTGASVTLGVAGRYPDGTVQDLTGRSDVAWTSSNPGAVSVDAAGRATALASGTALVTARYEGATGFLMLRVELAGDSDGDGIPDDVEIANGLDPNNPADGFEDGDGDTLATRDELATHGTDPRRADTDGDTIRDGEEVRAGADGFVTNPLVPDTDGDRFRDGLEVATGSDPTDPSSFNLAAALRSLRLAPGSFSLRLDTLFGTTTTQQLAVTAVLLDATQIDVTAQAFGVTYTASGACFADSFGLVVPVSAGSCGVMAHLAGKSASAVASVSANPAPLGAVDLPGFGNSVAVEGDYAFVAAGPAGLAVVDVTDRARPRVVAQLALAGNGNDLRLAGGYAFVAAHGAGLHVVDVSDPLLPRLVTTLALPGEAIDLALGGGYAYVAAGSAGLQVVDVSNPAEPRLMGGLDTPGQANGIDVAGGVAVLTDFDRPVQVIGVTDPAAPRLLATWSLGATNDRGFDVEYEPPYAYVATGDGLVTIELSAPGSPVGLGAAGTLFLIDVVRGGRGFLFAAGARPDTPLGIFDLTVAGVPLSLGELILSRLGLGLGDGTGVATDDRFLYVTASKGFEVAFKPGFTGATRLYVARYADFTDTAGLPPTVRILEPLDGRVVTAGRTVVRVTVLANDDVAVSEVRFLVNGQPAASDTVPPYQFDLAVPADAASALKLDAVAADFGGNEGLAAPVHLQVVPDELPAVTLVRPAGGESVREGQDIVIEATADDDFGVAQVAFRVNGIQVAAIPSAPYRVTWPVPVGAVSLLIEAVATDDRGQTATAARTVPVSPDLPPVVEILAPAEGSSATAGAPLAIQFTATDDTPPLQSLALRVNGTSVPFSGSGPYTASYPVPVGIATVTVEVTATDGLGRSTMATRTIPVADPPPVVALVSPAAGTTLFAGTQVLLAATASDNLAVASVEFRVDGQSAGSRTQPPYEVPFTVPAGVTSLRIEAVATDNAGHTATAGADFAVETPGLENVFIDPAFDVYPDFGSRDRDDLDVRSVGLEPLADAVRIHVEMVPWDGSPPQGWNAVLSFDLDRDPATGVRPAVDAFGPGGTTGLGADLELHLDDQRSLEGLPVSILSGGLAFVLEVPMDLLGGDLDFDFAIAVYDYAQGDLAADVAPNRGFWTVPSPPDQDGDGLTDSEEATLGTGVTVFDSDQDGVSDGFEVLSGFDPLDPEDPPFDVDGDGLDEISEELYSSDPRSADTDGDGLLDGDEAAAGLRPALPDTDFDGLPDGAETSTDPLLPDTDHDGLNDGQETAGGIGTNPAAADTDNGGVPDGQELLLDGTSPLAAGDDRRAFTVATGTNRPRAPALAVDGAGNLHVAWIQRTSATSFTERLFYRMLSPSGAVLIGTTQVTSTGEPDRPAVAVDLNGRVHLAWQDDRGTGVPEEIFYRVLDPSRDDRDGSPASLAAITVVAERRLSPGGVPASLEVALAVDLAGRAHVVWSEQLEGELRYSQIAANGTTLIDALPIFQGGRDGFLDSPSIALDLAGGLHVFWTEVPPGSEDETVLYMLLDPVTGARRIAATPLTGGDPLWDAGPARAAVRPDGQVEVVFAWPRREEIRWLRIDPGLDDRDGDAADPAALNTLPERSVSFPGTTRGTIPSLALDALGDVCMAFEAPLESGLSSTLLFRAFTAEGDTDVPLLALSRPAGSQSPPNSGPHLVRGAGQVWAVWSDQTSSTARTVYVKRVQ